MELEQSLTKKEFWGPLEQKYPNGTRLFYRWFEEYRERMDWDKMFCNSRREIGEAISLFNLPHAFQMGIWFEFLRSRGGCNFQIDDLFEFSLSEEISNFIAQCLEVEAQIEINIW